MGITCTLHWYLMYHMGSTCTSHGYYMHTTSVSHVYHCTMWVLHVHHMGITCISHGYHMHITWVSHAHHISISCLPLYHVVITCTPYGHHMEYPITCWEIASWLLQTWHLIPPIDSDIHCMSMGSRMRSRRLKSGTQIDR